MKKGLTYQKGSYISSRSALQCHLTYLKRPFNVRSDSAFNASNRILDAVLKHIKAHGLAKPVEHKDAINEQDQVLLRAYFADVLRHRKCINCNLSVGSISRGILP